MTDNIKKTLKQRSKLTKMFYKNGQRNSDHIKSLEKSEECTSLISEAKENYILKKTSKLEDLNTASKSYWSILNRFLYNKKTPAIAPLFVYRNFISDFCEKENLFNNFFASICIPIKTDSRLTPFIYKTNIRNHCFCVTNSDILSIINSLNSSKAHGYDNISIKMIKICKESVTIPLKIIFEEPLEKGIFPGNWKKENIISANKKADKNLINNYRPISLLSIFGKIFKRVVYNSLFNYSQSNKLFTASQSGFLLGDPFIAQLLSIVHEIQTVFDENPTVDVTGVLLDMSKAFDKVCHDDLIFKLKSYGVEGELLLLLKNYLHNREQKFVLNEKNI